jgi:hypothetical protein
MRRELHCTRKVVASPMSIHPSVLGDVTDIGDEDLVGLRERIQQLPKARVFVSLKCSRSIRCWQTAAGATQLDNPAVPRTFRI